MIILCTVASGFDSIKEVIRKGFHISAIVGLDPNYANEKVVSGWVDVADFAVKWNIRYLYVKRYDLNSVEDKQALESLDFDLIWVAGWQRLIPSWLIDRARLGVLGVHGSPDGIQGGRGRSPQNWAILLGCKRFTIALFRITPRVDDGPIIAERSFVYNSTDDISISYKKASLCIGEMICEVLEKPSLINSNRHQDETNAFYYPQRKPEDGFVDWNSSIQQIWAFCRALTKPYPGLRTTFCNGVEIIIWDCLPFDDVIDGKPGNISFIFEDGTFLVTAKDGRLLVRFFEIMGTTSELKVGSNLVSQSFYKNMSCIIERHEKHRPNQPLAQRIRNEIGK